MSFKNKILENSPPTNNLSLKIFIGVLFIIYNIHIYRYLLY